MSSINSKRTLCVLSQKLHQAGVELPEAGKKGAGPQEENKSLKEEVKTLNEELDTTKKGEEPDGLGGVLVPPARFWVRGLWTAEKRFIIRTGRGATGNQSEGVGGGGYNRRGAETPFIGKLRSFADEQRREVFVRTVSYRTVSYRIVSYRPVL